MSENTEAYRTAHAEAREVANRRVRAMLRLEADIPYGPHAREKIDFFPAAHSGGPLFAFFHPGYWRSRSRGEFSYLAPAFVERGVNFATIGYPLCPEVRLRSVVESARRAVAFLGREAGRLGFDATRLHVGGHSAGGHLMAMMAATDWTEIGLPADLVKSGVGISGLYDLAPVAELEVNRHVGIDATEIAELSPMTMAPRHCGPIVLTIGGLETDSFRRQMVGLASAWTGKGARVTIVETPDLYHFDVVDTLGNPGSPIFEAAMAAIVI
jgi:arylformamidase